MVLVGGVDRAKRAVKRAAVGVQDTGGARAVAHVIVPDFAEEGRALNAPPLTRGPHLPSMSKNGSSRRAACERVGATTASGVYA